MKKHQSKTGIPDELVLNKIMLIRGKKVMLDRDLAEMYGVETKVLKQAVRRNKLRFPADFMFEMKERELAGLRSQFVTSNASDTSAGRGGTRYLPFCFTEQGVAMLSSILNSERAIQVNIQIIRIFTRIREVMLNNKDILLKLKQLEQQGGKHEKEIQLIFHALKQLFQPVKPVRKSIGFKRKDER